MNRALRFSLATALAFSVTALHPVLAAGQPCPSGFDPAFVDGLPEDRNGNGMVCMKIVPGHQNGSRPYGFLIFIDDNDGNGD